VVQVSLGQELIPIRL